jgi:hypothetical protein
MSACENIDGQCGASWCNCDEKRKEQRSLAAPTGSVTVAYSIVDDKEWGATNPLRYEHNGLKAHTVAVFDAFERLEIFREALEKIADLNTGFSSDADKMNQIAKQALDESQNADIRDRAT